MGFIFRFNAIFLQFDLLAKTHRGDETATATATATAILGLVGNVYIDGIKCGQSIAIGYR